MVAGVLTWGVVSDLYGRKRVLVTMLLLLSLTGVLTALAPTYPAFVVARALNAFIVKPAYFTYMLEVASTSNHSIRPRDHAAVCGRGVQHHHRRGAGVGVGGGLAAAGRPSIHPPLLAPPRPRILRPQYSLLRDPP